MVAQTAFSDRGTIEIHLIAEEIFAQRYHGVRCLDELILLLNVVVVSRADAIEASANCSRITTHRRVADELIGRQITAGQAARSGSGI
jgi:hypothetical protein